MKNTIKSLELKLRNLDNRIEEVQKRLPAHSAKPPIMMELFDLEDKRDAVIKELEQLKQSSTEQ
ncbi:MAG: hypothetical protein HKO68_04065 [Desulfobacterales bacterium]|nr:hypothetical protein [Desulfobacterales bacterium]